MRFSSILPFCFVLMLRAAGAQGTVPTFQRTIGQGVYTLLGRDPGQNVTSTIPSLLVPITLVFHTKASTAKPFALDAAPEVPRILGSPVFTRFAFPFGGNTQYADAMLRATFPNASQWHTLLANPEIRPVRITVPAASGYVLTSRRSGSSFAVVDLEFLQKELFKQIPSQNGKLVIAVTRNTTFYALGDATVCCSSGTHGVDSATGNSFVLASFLDSAPSPIQESDVQPLTEQLGEFVNDPLHNPLQHPHPGAPNSNLAGNTVPAWIRPAFNPPSAQGACGGTGIGSTYFLLEPTDTNPRSNFPLSLPFPARVGDALYHLQNVALLNWYTGAAGTGASFSFPDPSALTGPAKPCPQRIRTTGHASVSPNPAVAPIPAHGPPNGHKLIGYWIAYGPAGSLFPLRDVSPQWDVVLVAFGAPDHHAPEGIIHFETPAGFTTGQFKSDIAYLKGQGRKVMLSLGGGGEYFALDDAKDIPNFVSSVSRIITEYGFDGIDLDFETPSLVLQPGDTDFRHPTTPSVVNLITALRQLRQRFGPAFLISLVPEGTQIPAGHATYGGQFGSYLPLVYALRDILYFVDAQDYNTPPLEGLDGEIYQLSGVDYHAAMTDLLLNGFHVAGDPEQFFPPLPASKVAVGFLTGETTPAIVTEAMNYLIAAKMPPQSRYKLHNPAGYPSMIGAMFWTIDADRRADYKFSNVIGPQLHSYPPAR